MSQDAPSVVGVDSTRLDSDVGAAVWASIGLTSGSEMRTRTVIASEGVLPRGDASDRLEVSVEVGLVVETAFGGHVGGPASEAQETLGGKHA